jgi:glyoxylase-like metal-dependent hydrolase (beta-lactamase superfamily II)
MVKMWFLNTGFCTVSEHHMMQDSPRRLVRAHALAVLLEHPKEGLILFDTGYTPHILQAYRMFPFGIYGWLTPTTVQENWTVLTQLKMLGLSAQDIGYVIVSHLHADHIAGLNDFKNTTAIISKEASELLSFKGFKALKHGFLPMLFPSGARVKLITDYSVESLFGYSHDLFNDGLLRLVNLPGHAKGQIGLYVQSNQGEVLLAADGAWTSRAYRENVPPNRLAMTLAFDDTNFAIHTLNRLHELYKNHPAINIIPTHCPEIALKIPVGIPTPLEAIL